MKTRYWIVARCWNSKRFSSRLGLLGLELYFRFREFNKKCILYSLPLPSSHLPYLVQQKSDRHGKRRLSSWTRLGFCVDIMASSGCMRARSMESQTTRPMGVVDELCSTMSRFRSPNEARSGAWWKWRELSSQVDHENAVA
jgi:hypothetical protein